VFVQLLRLVDQLVDKLEGKQSVPIAVSWNPTEWFSVVLGTFELQVCFQVVLDPQMLITPPDRELHHYRSHYRSCCWFTSNKGT
jgi:hypothetical protein